MLLEDVEIGPRVGGGHFGDVFRGTSFGISLALKSIKDPQAQKEFEMEVKILKYIF